MESLNSLQITVDELKETIKYQDQKINIFDYSNIFQGNHPPYRDTFIKNTRLKIYSIKALNNIQDEKFNMIINENFIKIIKYLIPQEYSLYIGINKNEDIENTVKEYKLDIPSKNYYEDLSQTETIIECSPEHIDKMYKAFWNGKNSMKVFILRKTSFYYLRAFFEENKNETAGKDFFNNIYAAIEHLPDYNGFILFSNKINHLEHLQEILKIR
ncbi:hypothetical protein HZA55_08635 [Candidatus Poribacteria bacterium]|nr:hypothetical protein [Candidatus Poribacteria bacterium]